jgi:hypothetical protein
MTWDNYGNFEGKWNIDHIHPLNQTELSDPVQFKKACHYNNLQPLWWIDNNEKSDNLEYKSPRVRNTSST